MKIWQWNIDETNYTDACMRDVTRYRGIAFMLGRVVADRFPSDSVIEIRSKKRPADYFMAGPYPVISSKLKKILESFDVQAEFVRTSLVCRKGATVDDDWFCFNATLVVDFVDRSASVFTAEKDYVTKIKKLVIRDDSCGSNPLSLAAKTIPSLIAVREDLCDEVLSSGCTGVSFVNTDEWRDPAYPN